MKQRQAVTKVTAKRYRQAGEKKQILDEFCGTTGYNRCYARWVLRHQGQRLIVGNGLVLEAEVRRDGKGSNRGPTIRKCNELWRRFGNLSRRFL